MHTVDGGRSKNFLSEIKCIFHVLFSEAFSIVCGLNDAWKSGLIRGTLLSTVEETKIDRPLAVLLKHPLRSMSFVCHGSGLFLAA